MTAAEAARLWARLAAAGLAAGPVPGPAEAGAPWFVRAMLGIAGWLGALFLIGFVALGFRGILDSAPAALAAGTLACLAAWGLARTGGRGDFAAQFAFAVSLAGQGLLLVGLHEALDDGVAVAAGMALVELVLFLGLTAFSHRVWSAAAGAAAVAYVALETGLEPFLPALLLAATAGVWVNEYRWPRHLSAVRAAGYGLTLVTLAHVVAVSPWWSLGLGWLHGDGAGPGGEGMRLAGGALAGAVLVALAVLLLRRQGADPRRRPGAGVLAAVAAVALASLKAPGLPVPLAILIVGFAHGNRVLVGMGIGGGLAYLSHYYYLMEVTLLQKSLLLVLTGTALLGVRALLLARRPSPAAGDGDGA